MFIGVQVRDARYFGANAKVMWDVQVGQKCKQGVAGPKNWFMAKIWLRGGCSLCMGSRRLILGASAKPRVQHGK